MDDSSESSLLNEQVTLIAEILSYVIANTQDLAKLRRVSKNWNASVLPFCLKNECFLRTCAPARHSYVKELVTYGESSYAGRFYRIPDTKVFDFWIRTGDDETGAGSNVISTDTMLMISDYEYNCKNNVVMEKQDGYSFFRDSAEEFSTLCKVLAETQSWDEFQTVRMKTISEGMFVCVQDLEKAKMDGLEIEMTGARWKTTELLVILTIQVPRAQVQLVEIGSCTVALLTAKVPKGEEDSQGPFPFLNAQSRDNPALLKEGDAIFLYPTFAGYNVKENDNGTIACQVPMAFNLSDGLGEVLWDWDTESYLPLECLWRKCQEQHVREGVAIADGIVPQDLHHNLMSQIDAFADQQIMDYHPHSNSIVRDIVHPALYSYVKGVSPLLKSEEEIRSLSYPPDLDEAERIESSPFDYWGRSYEGSPKYQWLPTYFDIGPDGNCTICDYINNLVPRSQHEDLYTSLAQLFSHALPLIESVYGYCRVVKEHHLRKDDEDIEYDDDELEDIQEVPVSLRGRQVQVVTKIVDYELTPDQTYEGVWHVEGMSHEEIVATAIYFIDRDDDIEGGNILFKRAFHKQEAEYIFSSVDQSRPGAVEEIISEGLQPLGQVKTIKGRLLVFPNSHVHKVTKLENVSTAAINNDGTPKKKRRIIVFFLINPERRIVSTREVPMQQEHVGGTMTRDAAMEHRLELMKERKFTKQDWNIREIELCEH
jgi:hypothetical protein